MRLQPQPPGGDGRIDPGLGPPSGFIATAMDLTVVAAAQRHGELITHFSRERAVLREPQMMGIGWNAAANQARLFGHELDVVLVTKAARLRMRSAGSCRCPWQRMLPRRVLGTAAQLTQVTGARMKLAITVRRRYQRRYQITASVAWNASSTWRASATTKVFFAPRIRCAQAVASSDEAIALSSAISRSRRCGRRLRVEDWFGCFRSGFYPREGRILVARSGLDRRLADRSLSVPASQLPILRSSAR